MTFQPVLVGAGIVGWRFLERTYDSQFETFKSGPQVQREIAYFRENIDQVQSAEDLVSDRRLLNVALSAYGLEDDLDNRYFIRKILEDGTEADDSLANRLADQRYADFSKAFGFGPGETPALPSNDFAESLVSRFQARSFEAAVGEVDDNMRIALNAERELADLATKDSSDRTKWFTVMGNPPLRELFETTFGLPSSFGQLELDQQLDIFQDRANAMFGDKSISQFTDTKVTEKLVETYLARAQIKELSAASSPASNALVLLSNLQFQQS